MKRLFDKRARTDADFAKTRVSCPGCGRALRLPATKVGKATCPDCRMVFDWAPECPELAELHFRCSVTGSPFVVAFGRRNSLELFSIKKTRLSDVSIVRGGNMKAVGAARYLVDKPKTATYNPADFSFNGLECPSCQFKARADLSAFVACNGCHGLVCGGCIRITNGKHFFRCHDDCGSRGELTEHVTSLEAVGMKASWTSFIGPASATRAAYQLNDESRVSRRNEQHSIATTALHRRLR